MNKPDQNVFEPLTLQELRKEYNSLRDYVEPLQIELDKAKAENERLSKLFLNRINQLKNDNNNFQILNTKQGREIASLYAEIRQLKSDCATSLLLAKEAEQLKAQMLEITNILNKVRWEGDKLFVAERCEVLS